MTSGQGDLPPANPSVPDPRKIPLLGRNVTIKKLRLGEKIKVSRMFAVLAKALKGDNYIKLSDGTAIPRKFQINDISFIDLIDSAPNFLHEIEVHYPDFLLVTTDLTQAEIQDLEMSDLFKIASEVWEYNGYEKDMEQSLGKVLRGGPAESPSEAESDKSQVPSKT